MIGEDYGEGASILWERTHSAAPKSSVPLIDPKNTLEAFARFVEEGVKGYGDVRRRMTALFDDLLAGALRDAGRQIRVVSEGG